MGGFAFFLIVGITLGDSASIFQLLGLFAVLWILWVVTYLILLLQYRRTRRVLEPDRLRFGRSSGRFFAAASAILLYLGSFLWVFWFLGVRATCAPGLSCSVSVPVPLEFLTSGQLFDIVFLSWFFGIAFLAVASSMLAMARRRVTLPDPGVHDSNSPARPT
jgi:hypothetical protein